MQLERQDIKCMISTLREPQWEDEKKILTDKDRGNEWRERLVLIDGKAFIGHSWWRWRSVCVNSQKSDCVKGSQLGTNHFPNEKKINHFFLAEGFYLNP